MGAKGAGSALTWPGHCAIVIRQFQFGKQLVCHHCGSDELHVTEPSWGWPNQWSISFLKLIALPEIDINFW